ncbi:MULTISPECIES: putative bifunctional diguanylate cyclase/phosphodiesterase [Pseudomonas]|uniref:EAL domain-containing protein n=1 Tax=Pseudomonas quercus TaxID=2722792 RepID=A0ABX0YKG0_9PSED|nr:EAL domain-containing protein [Pseudomonas sp. LY10J]MBF7143215.1 EAL domain-containing protein [Pseudomonas sp. LY10J]NJP01757.1 EAL domain-containing protein [Pseudomonas quercus]NJP03392.1 EAL domain-containing protein [Pseudomonas quercus]
MKTKNSVQWRISTVLVLLLLVVIVALTVAVKLATSDAVQAQAHQQLEVGGRVFERLLDMRGRRLRDGVQLLAADFGLRDAITSADAATIRSALLNHGGRIGASDAVLLGMDGKVMASTHATFAEGALFPYDQALREARKRNQNMLIVAWGGMPVLLVDAVVLAPLPIARVVMGFTMDDAFAQELHALSNLQVSFLAVNGDQPSALITTQPQGLRAELLQWLLNEHPPALVTLGEHDGQRFLEQRLELAGAPGTDERVIALLQSPLDDAMHAFAPLDHDILIIALAALVASLIGALLLARTISSPVRVLADAAERIGQGDYHVRVQLRRSDEFGTLASAINMMQAGIAEREHRLAHNALHDHLTGLPNRALAMERLGSAIAAERPAAVLSLTLDNLAALTTNGGTGFAENLLRSVGPTLEPVLRPGDTLAHLIGGEYLLVLEAVDAQRAVAVADRLQQALLKARRLDGHDFSLDASIGIAVFPDDGSSADVLASRAAIARTDAQALPGRLQLYQHGRDLVHLREVSLIRDLRNAAENGELLLHYQPKLDLRLGQVRQAEALLRWNHPQFGQVSPGEFIALAERTGSIQALTRWVIAESIRQLAEWNSRGLQVELSVNVSAEDLLGTDLADRVPRLLSSHGVPAQQLTFEITESAIMREPEAALHVLHQLRNCGISLSVDDFGTGYSSLAHLKRLPVQELKIDQSFVRDLDETSEDAVIVRSTIEMSHNLGLKVVAEGVEYERSLRLLERWNCDTAQGYLISRPLTAEHFEAWVRKTVYLPAKTVVG